MEQKEYFKKEAKMIVDMLFDSKCFNEKITRDDMNSTENFISEMMDSRFNSYQKLKELTKRIAKK